MRHLGKQDLQRDPSTCLPRVAVCGHLTVMLLMVVKKAACVFQDDSVLLRPATVHLTEQSPCYCAVSCFAQRWWCFPAVSSTMMYNILKNMQRIVLCSAYFVTLAGHHTVIRSPFGGVDLWYNAKCLIWAGIAVLSWFHGLATHYSWWLLSTREPSSVSWDWIPPLPHR